MGFSLQVNMFVMKAPSPSSLLLYIHSALGGTVQLMFFDFFGFHNNWIFAKIIGQPFSTCPVLHQLINYLLVSVLNCEEEKSDTL